MQVGSLRKFNWSSVLQRYENSALVILDTYNIIYHTYREQGQLSRDGATTVQLTLAYSWEGKLYELHNNSQILYPIKL